VSASPSTGVPILPELTVTFDRLKTFIQEALTRLGLPDSDTMTGAALMRKQSGIPIAPALMRGPDQVAGDLGIAKLV
jgi:hypothetical protein